MRERSGMYISGLWAVTLLATMSAQTVLAAEAVEVTTLTGSPGNGGITVHENGDLYVAEYGNYTATDGTRIFRISPEGDHATFATGLGLANSGNDFDAAGNLIQSAFASNVVRRINPQGQASDIAMVNGPVGVVVADNEEIFVASCAAPHSIERIRSGGQVDTFATHPDFNCPNGLTMGGDGFLYTINWNGGKIFRISPAGQVELFADIGTPGAHIVYGNGEFYATGRRSSRVYRITSEGEVSVLAGSGENGNDDGPPDEATFSGLNGIAISNDGTRLYVNGTSSATRPNGSSFNQIRVVSLAKQSTDINFGHTGSWFNPDQAGQGFSLEVVPATGESEPDILVAYWFTYARGASGGVNRQRWFQAQGPIEGNSAELSVLQVTGGIFNDPEDVTAIEIGTAMFEFTSCTEAVITYSMDLNGDGDEETTGEIPIVRLTPDVICGELADSSDEG